MDKPLPFPIEHAQTPPPIEEYQLGSKPFTQREKKKNSDTRKKHATKGVQTTMADCKFRV